MKYNCLIVDDERALADSTAEYFGLFGVKTCKAYGAEDCLNFFKGNSADLILLDINLGDGSGFELCKKLRESTDIPILFISARSGDDDQLAALTIGGDDYIQKPYSLSVLLAKVKAVLKRYCTSERWTDGRLDIDFSAKRVFLLGKQVKLKAMEWRLLRFLVENCGRVIDKNELFDKVWGDRFTGDGTLNVHIRRLREAIEENPARPQYIKTVWGEGYIFEGKKYEA